MNSTFRLMLPDEELVVELQRDLPVRSDSYLMYCETCGQLVEKTLTVQGNQEYYKCPHCRVSTGYTVR